MKRNRVSGREVHFTSEMKLTTKKEDFLSCTSNKARFLRALGNFLEERGIDILHASADADLLIVEEAVKLCKTISTVVVGEDTDLLILLLHHVPQEHSKEAYFYSEGKKGASGKTWIIKEVQLKLGQSVCQRLLFAHAILGCDTTSRLHGIGKGAALTKLFSQDVGFVSASDVFYQPMSSQEEVATAGEQALAILYGGSKTDQLDHLRYKIFQKRVSVAKSFVRPQDLPPTSAAAKHHSLRVFYQVQSWITPTASRKKLRPEEWGWSFHDGNLYPVTTLLPAAPESLLKVVRCNCKGNCASLRCTCRKNGLECSPACGECKGLHCSNSPCIGMEDETVDDI